MDDLAYLVPESAKAWLDGLGDGRFESYERYYRRALKLRRDDLDVEHLNEQYETYARQRARASTVKFGNALVVVTVTGFGLHLLGKVVVGASDVAPKMTGALMLGIVAFKIYQRSHRVASNKQAGTK